MGSLLLLGDLEAGKLPFKSGQYNGCDRSLSDHLINIGATHKSN
jgi:hypothetical protein